MDISDILSNYEDGKDKAREAEKKKREDEAALRAANAKEIDACFKAVIIPALRDIERQIDGKNYLAKVNVSTTTLPDVPGKSFELGCRLSIRLGTHGPEAYIEFQGKTKDLAVETVTKVDSQRRGEPTTDNGRPLDKIDLQTVEAQIKRFLEAVFAPPPVP